MVVFNAGESTKVIANLAGRDIDMRDILTLRSLILGMSCLT